MKLKNQTKNRLKGLGLSFLSMAFALQLNAQTENSPIPKSADAAALPTNSEAQADNKDAKTQEEVVVVGYGTMKKKDVTGAVASVSSKNFNAGVVNSPEQLIQGKASGISITSNSGSPSAGSLFTIRGNSSVKPDNQPLFVVDGVIMDGRSAKASLGGNAFPGENAAETESSNPLLFLNPSDIASIDILKDASATAIYGSRGANGVVLITTKKGTSGTVKIEASASVGISSIARSFPLLNATQYVDLVKNYTGDSKYFSDNSTYERLNNGVNTDAMAAILQTGITQKYGVAISGGGANSTVRTSINYSKQDGILKKSGLEKISSNTNANFNFWDKKAGIDLGLIATQVNEQAAPVLDKAGYVGSIVGMALQWNPTRLLKDANGKLLIDNGGSEVNPLAMSEAYNDYAKTNTVIASIAPYFDILPGLRYKMFLAGNMSQSNRKNEVSNIINLQGVQANSLNRGGSASVANNELVTAQISHTLNYDKEIDKDLRLNALVGYEYYRTSSTGSRISGTGFDNVGIPYYDMLAYSASTTRNIMSFNAPTIEIQSYFARASANYQGKYMLTATARIDGSSKFGSNNRYGFFPSFAAAWVLSNEDFLKGVSEINNLKLRIGWGQTGNQEFPAGSAQLRYGVTGTQAFGRISTFDSSLKWQTDQQLNVGLDFAILKNKISGSVDFFSKKTKDLIIPQAGKNDGSGNYQYTNLNANIQNTGIDFNINAVAVQTQDITWNIGLTGTYMIKNAVISGIQNNADGTERVIRTGLINGQGLSDVSVQRIKNGESLNTFWFATAGTREDIKTAPAYGTGLPTTILGINTSLSYKDLTLAAAFNGSFGQKVYNNSANILALTSLGGRNLTSSWAGTTLNAGDPTTNPANAPSAGTKYLEDGSYLRISNVTLSYNFSTLLAGNKYIKGASVYVTGQNLYVFTKFTGFDPEVNVNKSMDGIPSAGIEYMPYPMARTFVFGVNISL